MHDNSPPANHTHFTSKIYTMKQATLLITVVFLFSISSFGQLDKKTWLVGGSGNFSSTNDNLSTTTGDFEYKRSALQISPQIGVFVIDKLTIGLKSSFSWSKNRGVSVGTGLSTSTVIRSDYGPFIRYYFLDKRKSFNLLADLSYQLGNVKFVQSNDKGVRNNLSIMAGSVVYFNSSVGIEFLMGYKYDKEKLTKSNSTPQYFYTDSKNGIQISIGFQFYLEKI